MYIPIEQELTKRARDIVGYFDLDTTTASKRTRQFLEATEKRGQITLLGTDIPSSFVLTRDGTVYFTKISTKTLKNR